jgi:hypothetical protein
MLWPFQRREQIARMLELAAEHHRRHELGNHRPRGLCRFGAVEGIGIRDALT